MNRKYAIKNAMGEQYKCVFFKNYPSNMTLNRSHWITLLWFIY